ncbi:hypothetical protein WN51_09953 [Melipona quadrifasciata]|uniref:Uncharacterized protein n=1 Tax=Melipona quadrifasciata TaxID=166423 RepID=A0A0N0U7L8_9HYME|nr:hypothetical protein WN51_09953 [Melipona quadrifasciata]
MRRVLARRVVEPNRGFSDIVARHGERTEDNGWKKQGEAAQPPPPGLSEVNVSSHRATAQWKLRARVNNR